MNAEEKIYNLAIEKMARSVHHKVALEALNLIDMPWKKLFLKNVEFYIKASKVPDKKFHDFKNHVFHPHQDWGGAPDSVKEWYLKLVSDLKAKKWKDAIYDAGIMSHYFADVYHPFHTGQCDEEKRIHSYTEFGAADIYQQKIHPKLSLSRQPELGALSSKQEELIKFVKDWQNMPQSSTKPLLTCLM